MEKKMRNSKGQFTKGHTGNPNGRPKRADEQELLQIWNQCGREKFTKAIEEGKEWALKLLVDKLYPARKISEASIAMPNKALTVNFDSSFEN